MTTTPVSVGGVQPSPSTTPGGGGVDGGGGGSGGGRPLSSEAVFRIEVSLSSRKSSAIVMRTSARLYSLETSQGQSSPVDSPGKKHSKYMK